MTKPLSKEEKKQRKQARKQQKAKSTTVKTVTQPKPTETPPSPVNLCDDCAYEFGECEGVPKFAQEEGADDRVAECPAFVNVASMPTADQGKPAAEEPPQEAYNCPTNCRHNIPSGGPVDNPEVGGCAVEDQIPPESRYELDPKLPLCPKFEIAVEEETAEERAVLEADLEARRKKTQRFYQEEDFGTCQSCQRPLKRTALNRDRDAVRCVNGRCNQYRFIIRTIPTGV
ncbi:hypothetical protein ES703_25810 [subsurface metagenome]